MWPAVPAEAALVTDRRGDCCAAVLDPRGKLPPILTSNRRISDYLDSAPLTPNLCPTNARRFEGDIDMQHAILRG